MSCDYDDEWSRYLSRIPQREMCERESREIAEVIYGQFGVSA